MVQTLERVARRNLKSAYSGMHKFLHQEWYFVQRVTEVVGEDLHPVEDNLHRYLSPDLFHGAYQQMTG